MTINYKNKKLLVIAPHPDDEVLGCGGLISKVKTGGGKVHVLCFTVGNIKQYGGTSNSEKRILEMKKVMKYLKVDSFDLAWAGDEYHLKLDKVPQKDLINTIEKGDVSLSTVKPDILAIPFIGSTNQDHVAVAKASFTACRPVKNNGKDITKIVLSYEQPETNWTRKRFHPNFYVDISKELKKKINALSLYSSQVRSKNHPRTPRVIENIAKLRGTEIGVKYAEAYECHRLII